VANLLAAFKVKAKAANLAAGGQPFSPLKISFFLLV
jgi:hypothetical protein